MRYKYGDYIIRERKGRYYVYKLETVNSEVRETYVGPLIDVVETYIKIGCGDMPRWGCRPNPHNGPAGI
ncbi:putative integrase [Sulfurisphaera ohwakuensis]|uniref:putative integrase n=1 Tax=Sulfurisphaera ohwakuensis TaxID=69656 RepID=UPI0036F26743